MGFHPTSLMHVQRSSVLVDHERHHANSVEFLGIERFDIDVVSDLGRRQIGDKTMIVLGDNGDLFHRIQSLSLS